MDQAASIVPFILTSDRNGIAKAQRIHSWRQIDVMRYEYSHAVTPANDESLMSRTVIVVCQQPVDDPREFEHLAATTTLKRTHYGAIIQPAILRLRRAGITNFGGLPSSRFLREIAISGYRKHNNDGK
jgi:hypothetical protein